MKRHFEYGDVKKEKSKAKEEVVGLRRELSDLRNKKDETGGAYKKMKELSRVTLDYSDLCSKCKSDSIACVEGCHFCLNHFREQVGTYCLACATRGIYVTYNRTSPYICLSGPHYGEVRSADFCLTCLAGVEYKQFSGCCTLYAKKIVALSNQGPPEDYECKSFSVHPPPKETLINLDLVFGMINLKGGRDVKLYYVDGEIDKRPLEVLNSMTDDEEETEEDEETESPKVVPQAARKKPNPVKYALIILSLFVVSATSIVADYFLGDQKDKNVLIISADDRCNCEIRDSTKSARAFSEALQADSNLKRIMIQFRSSSSGMLNFIDDGKITLSDVNICHLYKFYDSDQMDAIPESIITAFNQCSHVLKERMLFPEAWAKDHEFLMALNIYYAFYGVWFEKNVDVPIMEEGKFHFKSFSVQGVTLLVFDWDNFKTVPTKEQLRYTSSEDCPVHSIPIKQEEVATKHFGGGFLMQILSLIHI